MDNMKLIMAGAAIVLLAISLVGLLVTSLRKKNDQSSKGELSNKKKDMSARESRAYSAAAAGGAYGRPWPQIASNVSFEHTVLMDSEVLEAPPAGGGILRYAGTEGWPVEIHVNLRDGETFTIGRFDITLGQSMSNYEFPADSKTISRRHVTISRDEEGYVIQDAGSKFGTFVNGVKLQGDTLYRLRSGYEIIFGIAGANYIWEEHG